VSSLDGTFAALADPTRRRVIDLLRSGPLRAGELASAVDMTPPAMSRHLRVLRTSGLVEEEGSADDARVRIYRLRREPFAELHGWLDEVESFWLIQLRAFRAHAERKASTKRKRAPHGRGEPA
jgi:DNA-binding transcriptional ArsR family regulator